MALVEAYGHAPEIWRNLSPVALLYTPVHCRLGRVQANGDVETIDTSGNPTKVDLTAAFESRAFCESGELRWLHEGGGKGRAVFLSEDGAAGNGWERLERINALEKEEGHYLLWGEGWCPAAEGFGSPSPAIAEGWSWLATSRIGKLAVPIVGIGNNDRVRLRYEEYYGFDLGPAGQEHGNVVVLEERLIGLQKAETANQQGKGEANHDAA